MVEWAPWLLPDYPWLDSLLDLRTDLNRLFFYQADHAGGSRTAFESSMAMVFATGTCGQRRFYVAIVVNKTEAFPAHFCIIPGLLRPD